MQTLRTIYWLSIAVAGSIAVNALPLEPDWSTYFAAWAWGGVVFACYRATG
jgi:hypothetical protein